MSLFPVNVTWTISGNGFSFIGQGLWYDTDTRQISQQSNSKPRALLDPTPPDTHLVRGDYLDFICEDYKQTKWFFDGTDNVYTQVIENSTECGWTPPRTCDLGTVTVEQTPTTSGVRVKLAYSGTLNGSAQYSLDGGPEQTGPTFPSVAVGRHTYSLRDDGVKDCVRTGEFEVKPAVAAPVLPAAPIGASQGIDFVAQPLWYPLASLPPGALVELELYAESAHGADDFGLVLGLRKRVDAKGQVTFRLDTLLLPLLSAHVPTADVATSLCTANLVNYYVRTTVTVAKQQPVYAISPLRTALRGGLPAEWQGIDYFAFRLGATFSAPTFLSWQPKGPGTYAAGQAKPIVLNQPEWLFWLCPLGQTDAQLRVRRAYFVTENSAPLEEFEPLTRPTARGWAQRLLAIPARATKAGVGFLSVRVETQAGVVVSQEARYEFVESTPRTRYVLFTNSLGGVDTLRCEGRLEGTLEATVERVERPARFGEVAPAADQQVSDRSAGRKLKLASGWLKAAELAWVQEVVLSRELWQQVGTQLRPLDAAKRTLTPYGDEPALRGLLLEFDYAYAPTAYAPPYAP
jgi:hypothetical protein